MLPVTLFVLSLTARPHTEGVGFLHAQSLHRCMRAGQLRHTVSIQSYDETADELGQPSRTYTEETTRRAAIYPMAGRELEYAKKIHEEITHKIVMRFYDLSPRDRLVFGSRTFEVMSVINRQERNREIEVMAKEIV